MTYTLTMAADQGIQIADDGVAEVSMTDARAQLTRLIRAVREDGKTAAFTDRGERRAYVVTPAVHQRAAVHQVVAQGIQRLIDDPVLGNRLQELDPDLYALLDSGVT